MFDKYGITVKFMAIPFQGKNALVKDYNQKWK